MKGIMFKEDLFEAIVAGKKTMTRRVINPQPPEGCEFIGISEEYPDKKIGFYWSDTKKGMKQGFWPSIENNLHPKYQPDEIVYLKEPYCYAPIIEEQRLVYPELSDYIYKYGNNYKNLKWKNKLFMPAKHARYFIKITNVRVQRLADISEDDAKAEGVEKLGFGNFYRHYSPENSFTKKELKSGGCPICKNAKASFISLFIKINGDKVTKSNPWVWVYEFELIEDYKIEN